jgi:hypothetical protein
LTDKFNVHKILVVLISLFAAIALSGCLGGSDEGPLKVKNIDLSLEKVTRDMVTLNVTTYIENTGGSDSKPLSLSMRVTNSDTGFLVSKKDVSVGKVVGHKMANVSQSLNLPKTGDTNKIYAALMEDGVEVSGGSRTVYHLDNLPVDTAIVDLKIGSLEFMVKKANNGSVVIENDVYISNIGDNVSPESDIMVKATEVDSNLVADKKWSKISGVAPGATAIKGINLTVPDQYNYHVEATIWRNGSQIGKGEGQVVLKPGGIKLNQSEHIESKTMETGRFISNATASAPTASSKAPGFEILLAIASISLLAALKRRQA